MRVLGIDRDLSNAMTKKAIAEKDRDVNESDRASSDLDFPARWSCDCVEFSQLIETPMRLLFEGMTKSLIELKQEWLVGLKKKTDHTSKIKDCMKAFSDLNLDFLKLLDVTGKSEICSFWVG